MAILLRTNISGNVFQNADAIQCATPLHLKGMLLVLETGNSKMPLC